MRNETRVAYNQLAKQIATLNGVDSATVQFSVQPSVQQKLETRIQESSEFLSQINMVGVVEQEGEKLGLFVTGTIAGRTDTKLGPRRPRSIADLTSGRYRCVQTNFDTAIPYAQLDLWAKFTDFQTRLRDVIVKQQALDRIMIGFNGTSAAEQTDRAANPLLQDVNIGWLEQYRDNAAARVMKEVKPASGKVRVGSTKQKQADGSYKIVDQGDYANLDALVMDAVNSLVQPQFAGNPDMVVILGRDMLADKYFPIVNQDNPPSEQMAADVVVSQKRIGGLKAVTVPFFPAGKMLITPLSNLSIYYQEGARRRHLKEEPEYNQVANYESSNDAYVVEAYEAGCLIENIEILPQLAA